jgi:ABC-type phosphate transport system auxiliary subunit
MHLKKKSWSVEEIARQVNSLSRECSSAYNDGFTAFELKKDLYQIKQLLDDALDRSPNFGQLEQDWLTEQEKKRIINILKS